MEGGVDIHYLRENLFISIFCLRLFFFLLLFSLLQLDPRLIEIVGKVSTEKSNI